MIVSLCRSARLREARRADLARYFGAQLAPSAALQATDATLLQALEVSPVCSEAKPIAAYTNDIRCIRTNLKLHARVLPVYYQTWQCRVSAAAAAFSENVF
jgi:hypothetical protein